MASLMVCQAGIVLSAQLLLGRQPRADRDARRRDVVADRRHDLLIAGRAAIGWWAHLLPLVPVCLLHVSSLLCNDPDKSLG